MSEKALPLYRVNAQWADTIELGDRGFLYGDGVFTTIRINDHKPQLLERHLERLAHDAQRLGIEVPAVAMIRNEISLMCEHAKGSCALRYSLTRAAGQRGYAYMASHKVNQTAVLNQYTPRQWDQGVRLMLCRSMLSQNKRLAGVKHLNRLEQVLASAEVKAAGFDEGVMMDQRHCIIEGTMSNVFCIEKGVVLTPCLSYSGINGVMRRRVLEVCDANGIPTKEVDLSLEDFQRIKNGFVTNSLIGLHPVRSFDGEVWNISELFQRIKVHCYSGLY